jgi:hypothetical protein
MTDRYTKAAPTAIAVCLAIIAAQNAIGSSAAQMDRVQKVQICNGLAGAACDDVIKVQICDLLRHCADLSTLKPVELPSPYPPTDPRFFLPSGPVGPRLPDRYGLAIVQDRQ